MNQMGYRILVGMVGAIATLAYPISVQAIEDGSAEPSRPVESIPDLDRAATTVAEWLAQESSAQSLIQVIGVQVNVTETGLAVVLETAAGELTVPVTSVVGNAVIADIPNAELVLPDGDGFQQANPIEGVALVSVTRLPGDRVRVAITGEESPPTTEIQVASQALVLNVTPGSATATSEEEAIQVVVTGEQDEGYNPSNATTATRTDTPLRDIPASISVIPRQVLEDQNTLRLQDALQNVSSVNRFGNLGGIDAGGYIIRGFTQDGNFRNGLPDNDFYSSVDTSNIERIEVLRGPASVLFGQVEPGGIVNVVTEQPLSTPYYTAAFNVGSYEFYRPSIDFSGPLTEDGSVLYRLNVAYQSSDSFRDFNFTDRTFVAPVMTFNISDRTALTIDAEYLDNNYFFDRGIPSLGDRPAPIPIDRLIGLPGSVYDDNDFRIGYRFQHQFSPDWQLRNVFSFVSGHSSGTYAIGGGELVDKQFSEIFVGRETFLRETYTLQTEVEGQFNTGSIVHRPLIGVELRRNTWNYTSSDVAEPILQDIFNPDYDVPLPDIPDEETYWYITRRDTLGVYLQNQITLAENLKLLLGGRFDSFYRREDSGTTEEESLTAFSPRLGVVYQPIQPISLYASYSESFQPDRFFGRSATGEPFKPTRGTQYEVGLKAEISEQLSATLAAYHLTRTNVVTPDASDPRLSVQVGEQRSQGIELDLSGEILPGWDIIASYAYTDAITSEDNEIPVGNRINGVPENAASLWTNYEIQQGDLSGLGFGLGLYYVGDRFADNENTSTMESYFRVDAAVYYERENWRVGVNVRNLFDETYYEASQSRNTIYPGAPFTLIGSVSVQF